MSEVIDLADRRPPVTYRVVITAHWDGTVEYLIEDVSDDPRSRQSVVDAMRRFCGFQDAADDLNRALLDRIDALMGAAAGTDDAAELSRLADVVQRYEAARYPTPTPVPPARDETEM